MRVVTQTQLLEDIRTRYDLPAWSATTRITTTQAQRLINLSLQSFYAMLCEAYGDNYFAQSYTFTTQKDVGISSLPADFYKLLSLAWRKDTAYYIPIRKASTEMMMTTGLDSKSWTQYVPHYRLTSQAIQWARVPADVYTVDMWYVALPADLVNGSDSFNGGPGWDEWVTLDVCRRIAESEQKDISTWKAMRDDVEQRIRTQSPDRDESEAMQVRDTDPSLRRTGFWGGSGGTQAVHDWLTEWG